MHYHWSRALFVSGHAQHALHFGFSVADGAEDVMTLLTSLDPLATEFPIFLYKDKDKVVQVT